MYLQNYVNLDGNLCGDIEIKETTKGTKYCHFSICYNEYYKDKESDEWKSIPNYFNCEAWGKTAENCEKYKKGELVSVVGKLKSTVYEDENNNKKKYETIVVRALRKLSYDKTEKFEAISNTENSENIEQTELNEVANKAFNLF